MCKLKVSFFVCVIGSVLSLSGYADVPSQQPPKLENKAAMSSAKKQPEIKVKGSDGKDILAKNNFDGTWTVSGGKDVDGMIEVNPNTGRLTYQSSASKAPISAITLDADGTTSITTVNALGSHQLVVIDAAGGISRVEVTNSPKNKLVAKRSIAGLWEITGTNPSGKSVKGALEIDSETGFVAYKGTNGDFTYQKPLSVESIVVGMSTFKGPLSNESLAKMISSVDENWTPPPSKFVNVLTDLVRKIEESQ